MTAPLKGIEPLWKSWRRVRVCPQLSQIAVDAKQMAVGKLRAILS